MSEKTLQNQAIRPGDFISEKSAEELAGVYFNALPLMPETGCTPMPCGRCKNWSLILKEIRT
jgi:hypothetical protein